MEWKRYKYNRVRRRFEEIPTIVVDRPKSDEVPYVDEETKFIEGDDARNEEKADGVPEDEDEDVKKRRESLGRRNSISLPNLDDLKVLKERVAEVEDYGKSASNSDEDDEEFR